VTEDATGGEENARQGKRKFQEKSEGVANFFGAKGTLKQREQVSKNGESVLGEREIALGGQILIQGL